MFQINDTLETNLPRTIRRKVLNEKSGRSLDTVMRAAQSLFAQDIWVNQTNIARELEISMGVMEKWANRKGSLIRILVLKYQSVQKSFGMRSPQDTRHQTTI